LDISAAAALVKVRHKIREGSTPASNRRMTLRVSTKVLPDPAFAETHADVAGSVASAWACNVSAGI
jgi:hypothetical protein